MAANLKSSVSDAVSKLSKQESSTSDKLFKPSKEVATEDIEKFNNLISQKNTNKNTEINFKDKPKELLTLGDKILGGVHKLGTKIENQATAVKMELNSADVSDMQSMFKAQLTMSKLLITEDYIAKIVSKGTQAFDTLLKNQ